ncbi:hypothetical protein AB0F20_38400 [Streptomyces goshikiensis]
MPGSSTARPGTRPPSTPRAAAAVGAHVVSTVDRQHQVGARLGPTD